MPARPPRRRRILAGAAAVGLVAVSLLGVHVVAGASDDVARRCESFARTAAVRATEDTGPAAGPGVPRVVVIGDSFSVGYGLDAPDDTWTARLPGHVHVDGFSGSGFSADDSPCEAVSYADRAARAVRDGADLVVVEGGLNDVDQGAAAIRRGFERLMGELAGHDVLVVGPTPAPARADGVPRVDVLLAALAAEHDVAYLSVADVALDYLPDDLHPTAAGHQELGDLVGAEATRLLAR